MLATKPQTKFAVATTVQNQSSEERREVDWSKLVFAIKAGDGDATEELYRHFGRGLRYYIFRQVGAQDLDDRVHDTFLLVVNAIRRGALREPERLMGFVRTVMRRQVAGYIVVNVKTRREQANIEAMAFAVADSKRNPEEDAIVRQRAQIVQEALAELRARDRDVLVRFYLHEQTQEQICREMDLTETQFRLIKSRAKAKFGDIGKKRMAVSPVRMAAAKAQTA